MALLGWHEPATLKPLSWTCGYCGNKVGGVVGFRREDPKDDSKMVRVCPHCQNATVFVRMDDTDDIAQVPGPVYGSDIGGLPDGVAALYAECRRCVQYTAYTAGVLAMRKLIMQVAVEKGADERMQFTAYVDHLVGEGFIPSQSREWVDQVRKYGNLATHEVAIMSRDDAVQMLDFIEMLLTLVYEFPGKINRTWRPKDVNQV